MIRVRCFETELAENGESIAIGDALVRMAVRHPLEHFGTELDALWGFDGSGGSPHGDVAMLAGVVVAVDAIYVELTSDASGGWKPRLGSVHLESVRSTAETRRPLPTIDWLTPSAPDADGLSYGMGYAVVVEGDESLQGWVITVRDEVFSPALAPWQ